MTTEDHRLYFDFLRFSLDESAPVPEGIVAIDWDALYDFATRQTLVGVYFHGIMRLSQCMDRASDAGAGGMSALGPKGETLARWLLSAEQIRRLNVKVTRAAQKVAAFFDKHSMPSFVLKGQGNALMYPDTGMRTPGDVDVFVGGGDRAVIAFARKKLGGGKHFCYHHTDVMPVDGVEVEVHYRPSFMHNPFNNVRLQRWFAEKEAEQCANRRAEGFSVPTTEYNVVYQLVHLYRHFMQDGVGLRQLTDYYVLLMSRDMAAGRAGDAGDSDCDGALAATLKSLGLYRFAAAVMWVLGEIMRLPAERMIVAADKRLGRVLLDEMLAAGNFGRYDERVGGWRRTTAVGRNVQRFLRDMRLCLYFPSETLWEPPFRLWHYLWRKNKGFQSED